MKLTTKRIENIMAWTMLIFYGFVVPSLVSACEAREYNRGREALRDVENSEVLEERLEARLVSSRYM